MSESEADDTVFAMLEPGSVDWGPAGRPSCVSADQERMLLGRPGFASEEPVGVATEHSIEDPDTGEITGRMRLL